MSKSQVNVEEMMEAGLHFGHQTFRRNPKMNQYIFGTKDGVHIIDLTKTEPMLVRALEFASSVVSGGGQIVFVGTKRQAHEIITEQAKRCKMPYVADRWLGGLLTNYDTVKKRLKYLREIDEMYEKQDFSKITKKEKSDLDKEYAKLQLSLGGLRDLRGIPAALFVVDVIKDKIAIQEARKLNIPVIGMVDTNADPDLVNFPIPSNDDARKAIDFVVTLMATHCQAVAPAKIEAKAEAPKEEVEPNQTQEGEDAN